jgi:hypothetical protein
MIEVLGFPDAAVARRLEPELRDGRHRRQSGEGGAIRARAISQAKRVSSVRVSIGDTREMSTRTARATAKEYLAQISRGQHPNPLQNQPSGSGVNVEEKTTSAGATLKQRGSGIWKAISYGRDEARGPSPVIAIT